jgi:hypothetical protein
MGSLFSEGVSDLGPVAARTGRGSVRSQLGVLLQDLGSYQQPVTVFVRNVNRLVTIRATSSSRKAFPLLRTLFSL